MKPGADRVSLAKATCLTDQYQKRGLKGVIDIVRVAQMSSANTQYHWAKPGDERLERQLVSMQVVSIQELPIRKATKGSRRKEAAEVVRMVV